MRKSEHKRALLRDLVAVVRAADGPTADRSWAAARDELAAEFERRAAPHERPAAVDQAPRRRAAAPRVVRGEQQELPLQPPLAGGVAQGGDGGAE